MEAYLVFCPLFRNNPLVLGNSNGSSVYINITETILNGLIETIEREAFMMRW
jgi:ribosomal protein S12 methylthiotransferase accessory factor YcaO